MQSSASGDGTVAANAVMNKASVLRELGRCREAVPLLRRVQPPSKEITAAIAACETQLRAEDAAGQRQQLSGGKNKIK